ncbi:hypothetical protein SBY92_001720 [Candida maltosa Xu316]
MDDDIKSIVSSNDLTKEQLRQAAKSPIAKKLHIIASNPASPNNQNSKYVIPIPFTLKLPPKLSSQNNTRESSAVSSVVSSPKSSRACSPSRSLNSSRSSSPKKPKQAKLVYTKNGYEKIDTSSESESEFDESMISTSSSYQEELNKKIALSRRPVPSVLNNNTKFNNNNNNKGFTSRSADELSIIEEVSRASSMFSTLGGPKGETKNSIKQPKLATPVPIKPPQVIRSDPIVVPLKINETKTKSEKPKPTVDKALPVPPPRIEVDIEEKPTTTTKPQPSEIVKLDVKNTTADTSKSDEKHIKGHKYNKSLPPIPVSRTSSLDPGIQKSQRQKDLKLLSFGNAPAGNFNNILKIHKRSFSDESCVSSVSSFSSVGDFMHISRMQAMSPPTEKVRSMNVRNQQQQQVTKKPELKILPTVDEQLMGLKKPESKKLEQNFIPPPKVQSSSRQVSTSSDSSSVSTSSWDSLQKSIDITYSSKYEDNDKTKEPPKVSQILGDDSSWLDTSGTSDEEEEADEDETELIEETKPLNISRQSTATSGDIKVQVNETLNSGPGQSFQFPNNASNATNSQEARSKVLEEYNTRKSRYSFYSADGHIEIPDLADKRTAEELSTKTPSSYNGTTFSETRTETSVSDCEEESHSHLKIGFPGKDAIKHLKQQYNALGDDSDVEYASNLSSLYVPSKPHTKSIPMPIPPQQQELQCNLLLPSRASPVRHSRHKSMFNIDFDINKSNNDVGHSRNKSMDIFSEMSTFGKEQARVELSNTKPEGCRTAENR